MFTRSRQNMQVTRKTQTVTVTSLRTVTFAVTVTVCQSQRGVTVREQGYGWPSDSWTIWTGPCLLA